MGPVGEFSVILHCSAGSFANVHVAFSLYC